MKAVKTALIVSLAVFSLSAPAKGQSTHKAQKHHSASHRGSELIDQRMKDFKKLLQAGVDNALKFWNDVTMEAGHIVAREKGASALVNFCDANADKGAYIKYDDCAVAIWITMGDDEMEDLVTGHNHTELIDNPDSIENYLHREWTLESGNSADEARKEQLMMRKYALAKGDADKFRKFCFEMADKGEMSQFSDCNAVYWSAMGADDVTSETEEGDPSATQ